MSEKRNLISNFLSLSVLQVLSNVTSLITVPYLARTIGVENFGKITFALSIVTYFKCIVEWGFKYPAVRDIAQNRENPIIVSEIISKVICASILLLFLAFVLLVVIVYTIPFLYEERKIIFVTALILPGCIIQPDWLFQAMEKMKYITLMNIISKILFTVLIFFIIRQSDDYIYEPLLQSCSLIIPASLSLIYAIKMFKLNIQVVPLRESLKMIKDGFPVFLVQFMPTVYNNFSIILLGALKGQVAVGIFSCAYKLIGISEQLANVVSRTFFPFLARRMDKHDIYSRILSVFSIAVSLVLLFGADLIVELFFSPEYYDAKRVLRIISFGPFFLFLRSVYGINGLVLLRKEKIYSNIILCSSVVGMVISIILVPVLGADGVAITLSLTWSIMGIVSYCQYKKYRSGYE